MKTNSSMKELTLNEVMSVSGGECTWSGLGKSVVGGAAGGAATGAVAGAFTGPGVLPSAGIGALGGAAGGAATNLSTCWMR